MSEYSPRVSDPVVQAELQRIAQIVIGLGENIWTEEFNEPSKPRNGMVRFADGTSWDPGSGAGLYLYNGATWNFLQGAGGSGETNTGSNQGTDGFGVFDGKVGVDLEFRHIAPASSKLSVALNGNDIDLDVVEGNLSIPIGQVTGFTDNSGDWDTAFGFGDHAGLYELVDAAIVKSDENEIITAAWEFRTAAGIRISNAAGTDWRDDSHDDTDFNSVFVNTTDWNVTGIIRLNVPSLDVTNVIVIHDISGTRFTLDQNGDRSTITAIDPNQSLEFMSFASVQVRDGAVFRVQDPGDTDWAAFSHNSTDFNTVCVNTIDWNITGLNGFKVVNYHFDVDQTVGAGQDGFVLTYDDADGEISLEAPTGGGTDFLDITEFDDTDATYYFYGGVDDVLDWKINRYHKTTFVKESANEANNPSETTLASAWPNRLTLTYA